MSFKKNNPGKMLMDAILCWEGRPMYEKEFRKYCGLGHELLLKVRKALIGAGLITYEVTPRGTIYRLTDQGRRMMEPDESLDHRIPPEYLSDMPRVTGHFTDFSAWAEAIMDKMGDNVHFVGLRYRRDLIRVYSERYLQNGYYRIREMKDGTLLVD